MEGEKGVENVAYISDKKYYQVKKVKREYEL